MASANDERVVSMKFDNAQFERGVSQTVKSLGNLKKSLNLEESAKGLTAIERAGRKFDLSHITDSLDVISSKFTHLGMLGVMEFRKIADAALNAGNRILKALTIDPVTTGFNEYELKMNSVQTIMSSTGKSIEEVNGYLDELNTYSDRTIYSFQDMTSNIGKFTNAGVSLDDAVAAIKGISNEAAVSGANANEASRAMYNFSQALSSGVVRLIDWKSIENANMATKEFKQELLDTAVALGTVEVAEDGMYKKGKTAFNATKSFNDSLQEQWMTSEVLIETLKRYSDETTDIGKKAYSAAQDVKTFSQLYDTLKEAAQSGWAQTWEILVGDLEEAKKLLTSINNVVGDIIGKSAESRNYTLERWDDIGGRLKLIEAGKNIFISLQRVMSAVSQAFREIFPKTTYWDLMNITNGFLAFTEALKPSAKTMINIRRTFKGLFAVLDIGKTIFTSAYDAVKPLFSVFSNGVGTILDLTASLGDYLVNLNKSIKESGVFSGIFGALVDFIKPVVEAVVDLGKSVGNIFKSGTFGGLFKTSKAVEGEATAIEKFESALSKTLQLSSMGLSKLVGAIKIFVDAVGESLAHVGNSVLDAVPGIVQGFATLIIDVLGGISDSIGDIVSLGAEVVTAFLSGLSSAIPKIAQSGIDFAVALVDGLANAITNAAPAIWNAIGNLLKSIGNLLFSGLKSLLGKIPGVGGDLSEGLQKAFANPFDILNTGLFSGILLGLVQFVKKLNTGADEVTGFMDKIKNIFAPLGDILGAFQSKIKAGALKEIAKAIAILAGSLAVLSLIDPQRLGVALIGLGAAMAGLYFFMGGIGKAMKRIKIENMVRIGLAMKSMATSILILSAAMAVMAHLDWGGIAKGVVGIGALLTELGIFTVVLGKIKFTPKDIGGMVALATSLVIMSGALTVLSSIHPDSLLAAVAAMGAVLFEIGAFAKMTSGTKGLAGMGAGMILMATSMIIFASAIGKLGGMDLPTLGKGLLAMGVALAEIAAAVYFMPATTPLIAVGLVAMAVAMNLLGVALTVMGKMSMAEIGKSLLVMGGALVELAIGCTAMIAALPGAFALKKVAMALLILAPALMLLGKMKMSEIGKSLLVLAGAFTVIGIAATVLGPLTPAILGLAGAIALLSLAIVGVGAGIALFAAGFAVLASVGTAGSIALVGAITALASTIPIIVDKVGESLVIMAQRIIQAAPMIGTAVTSVIVAIVTTLSNCTGILVNSGMKIIGDILTGIANNIGTIVQSGIMVVANFMNGIAAALPAVIQAGIGLTISFINGMANGIRDNSETLYLAFGNLISSLVEFAITGLQSIVEMIPGIGPKMAEGLESAKNAVREALTSEEMTSSGSSAMDAVASGAKESVGKIEAIGGESASVFKAGFEEQLAAGDFTESLSSFINNPNIDMTSIGTEMGEQALAGLQTSSEEMASEGTTGADNYASGLRRGTHAAMSSGKAVAHGGSVGADSKRAEFVTAGNNMAAGVAKGIDNGSDAVSGAAARMAEAAVAAFNRIMDSHSPSRVMMKSGRWFDEGVEIGIRDYSYKVERSAARLAEGTIQSFTNTISRISDLVENNIDTTPVIRPVMDLSDIRAGAKMASSMLSGVRFRAKTTSDMAARGVSTLSPVQSEAGESHTVPTSGSTSYNFTQINHSPKALSRIDLYRDGKNLFSAARGVLNQHVK